MSTCLLKKLDDDDDDELAKRVHLSRMESRPIDEVRTLPPTPPEGWLKKGIHRLKTDSLIFP